MDDHLLFRSLTGRSTPVEEASVQSWRRQSPENDRRYTELAGVLAATKLADVPVEVPVPSPLKLIHQAESRPTRVVGGRGGGGDGVHRDGWSIQVWPRWIPAAAAVLVLSFLFGRSPGSSAAPIGADVQEFATGAAEAATVILGDGTVVRLGPKSRLRSGSLGGREVELWGRALFSVVKDSDRPFRIYTAGGSVEVLGTRFEIESNEDELRVAVIEGRVALSAQGRRTEVPAGEMRRVVGGATLPAVEIADLGMVGDWVGLFLAFQDTPLFAAVAEIERLYGVTVQVDDPQILRQTISAWFSDQSVEHVMRVVCLVAQAHCEVDQETGVIRLGGTPGR